MNVLLLGVGAALVIVVVFVLRRMNELFCVSIRNGRCLVVRGRVPPSMMREIADVARRANIRRGEVRVVKREQRARLVTRGVDEGTTQRLRNVVGNAGLGRMKVSEKAVKVPRNLGQLVGVAWLAWMLGSSD